MIKKCLMMSGIGILMCLTMVSVSCGRREQTASKQEPDANKPESKPPDVDQTANNRKEAEARTVEPVAMTREEAEKQLTSEPKVTGDITLNGNPLCSIDGAKAQTYFLGDLNTDDSRPSTWAVVNETPTLVIRLSSDMPNRVTLTRINGTSGGSRFSLEKDPNRAFTYNLRFAKSPGPGDYEFGTTQGSIALYFRCGFTIEKAP